MRSLLILLALCLVSGCACRSPLSAAEVEDLARRTPVRQFSAGDVQAAGSSIAVGRDTLLTCAHLVSNGHLTEACLNGEVVTFTETVTGDDGTINWSYTGTDAQAVDRFRDWCLSFASSVSDQVDPAALPLNWERPLKVGDQVLVVGYSLHGEEFEETWVLAQVVKPPIEIPNQSGDLSCLQASDGGPFPEGLSGGAVVLIGDCRAKVDGEVVAMFCASIHKRNSFGEITRSWGRAIPLHAIRQELHRMGRTVPNEPTSLATSSGR